MTITMNLIPEKHDNTEITPVFNCLNKHMTVEQIETSAWHGVFDELLKEHLTFIEAKHDEDGCVMYHEVQIKSDTRLNLYINTKRNTAVTIAIVAILKYCARKRINVTLNYRSKNGQYTMKQHFSNT